MNCIRVLVDEDFGLKSVEFNNPRVRKGARGIIINSDGKIAVFNKASKNEYKLPGGGIDEGENPEEAFKREALEETGCEIEIINSLGTIEEHKSLDNFKQTSYIFVAKVVNDTHKLNLTQKEKDEGAQLLWVDDTEALKLITDCYDKLKESKYENL
ncbi:MAG: NUDIX domain-containing protein, partial [Erysipelotrichaceae bacterium]|nr:NUDIX domain-containing protein [Erysipelotrichaceae bacterium]